jgi:hypothetical protein
MVIGGWPGRENISIEPGRENISIEHRLDSHDQASRQSPFTDPKSRLYSTHHGFIPDPTLPSPHSEQEEQ